MPYRVLLDESFHNHEGERTRLGDFDTLAEATAACEQVVNEFLHHHHTHGMTAEALYALYLSFGEDPVIVGEPAPPGPFPAKAYVKRRCAEICAGR